MTHDTLPSAGPTLRRRAWVRLALAGLLALPVALFAQTTERYTVTIQGQVSGSLVKTTDADGRAGIDFSYRDNGRGPDIREDFAVDALAAFVSYQGRGKSTFGGDIRDDYTWRNGRAEWTSLVDRGERAAPQGALYYPVEGSPEVLAQLARSLLARPDHSAPAVAGGKFSIERLETVSLDTAGGAMPVTLYALIGIDVTPTYLWLREDAGGALFALLYPGWELMAAGHEAQGAALMRQQMAAQTERLHTLAQRLTRPLVGLTVIRDVRWFDAARATMRGPSDVYLFEGRIAAIEAPGSAGRSAAQTINGRGRTLLPGLFDMHGHLWPEEGLFHLAAGVTSVRDVGNQNADLLALRDKIDSGVQAGPRISANGFIEGKSPFSARSGIVVASLDEAKAAADWYAEHGYRQLKIYNSFSPAWVKPLAAYAHARGLRVGGHVPAFMRAEEAVRAGYDELHHINQAMLNFFVKPKDDTRTLLRFTLVGDKAKDIDLDGAKVQAFLKLLHAHGTVVDPTAGVFEALFNQRNGQPNPSFGSVADHMPVATQRWLLSNSMDVNEGNARRYGLSYTRMLELIGRMHRAGVPLVAGTDSWAGFGLQRELELYVKAGIPAPQVLKIATWNGARYTQTLAQTGTIEAGKLADLVLIDGDPSVDISDIRKVSLVIKGRAVYRPSEIYDALGIRPFVAPAEVSPAPTQ